MARNVLLAHCQNSHWVDSWTMLMQRILLLTSSLFLSSKRLSVKIALFVIIYRAQTAKVFLVLLKYLVSNKMS